MLKNIPEGVNKRLSSISSNEDIFNQEATLYQEALDESGHNYKLYFEPPLEAPQAKKEAGQETFSGSTPHGIHQCEQTWAMSS